MPFGEDLVEITYRANVEGIDSIKGMVRATEDLNASTSKYSAGLLAAEAVKKRQSDADRLSASLGDAVGDSLKRNVAALGEATVAHQKHRNALLQAHTELRQFRRELFLAGFAVGIVVATLAAMAKGSESAQIGFERLTTGVNKFLGTIADSFAKTTAFWGAIAGGASIDAAHKIADAQINEAESIKTTIELLNLKAQTAKISGDEQLSIALKYDAAVKALDLEPNKTKASKVEFELEMQRMKEQSNLRLNQKVKDLQYESQTESLRGNDLKALHMKQEAENTQILLEGNATRRKIRQADADARHAEEERDLELTSLGLKRQAQIYKDYVKDVVSGTQKTSSDVLFDFLQGNKQSLGDIAKAFQSMFNRAFSDAITNSIMTSMNGKGGMGGFFSNLFTGGKTDSLASGALNRETPIETNARLAVETAKQSVDNELKMIALLSQIAECTCSAAKSTGGIMTATITPGKESTWSKLASATGSIAGAISGIPGLGGLPGGVANPGLQPPAGMAPMAGPEYMPVVNIPGGPLRHSGGFVSQFPSGGEVPIMAQPGEFIVRKSVSQDNKELLKSINSGARQSKNAQNIYFITANDAKSFADMLSSPSAQGAMEMQITRAIMANGSLRNAIRSFGG